jgi:hypothetical protein
MKITSIIFLLFQLSAFFSCTLKPDLEAIEAQLTPYPAPVISGVEPSQLFTGGGTTVEITGENFAPGISVKINGSNCLVMSLTGTTQLQCLAPASAEGTFAIEVTGFDGKTDSDFVTYDKLAYSRLSLVVGKLTFPSTNADGFANNGDSKGASQMAVDGNYLYTVDYDGHKFKKINLSTFESETIVGTGVNSGPDVTDPNPLLATLSNPQCLVKSGNIAYFCLSDRAIGKMDLSSGAITVIAGRVPADSNTYAPGDPLGDNFYLITHIFLLNDMLYVIDWDVIYEINLTTPAITAVAGTYNSGAMADGNGPAGTFDQMTAAELLGDKLYVFDEDSYGGAIRKIDLGSGNFEVTTVLGDIADLPAYGEESVDGVGNAATLNIVKSITTYGTKLMLADEFDGDQVKIRIFDPATGEINTMKTILTASNKHILGAIDGAARIRAYQIRGIKYVENFGLLLGTSYGLLRLQ